MHRLRMLTILVVAAALATLAPSASAANLGGELLDQPGRLVQLGPDAEPLPSVWAKTWLIADSTPGTLW